MQFSISGKDMNMNEYKAMWKNYANFTDRTSARGYWMAFLFNFLVGLILNIIIVIVPILFFLPILYSFAVLIPGLALNVRRLRDAGKHWAWLFITLVPLVGAIVLIVFLCQPTSNNEGIQV